MVYNNPMSDQKITCPHCGTPIPLSEALLQDIQGEALRQKKENTRRTPLRTKAT